MVSDACISHTLGSRARPIGVSLLVVWCFLLTFHSHTGNSRGTTDVHHVIKAVGSRSKASADEFITRVVPPDLQSQAAGGTYEDVYNNPDVDVVYVGTPHTYHYENTRDALNAGKHVLCEKVRSSNSAWTSFLDG